MFVLVAKACERIVKFSSSTELKEEPCLAKLPMGTLNRAALHLAAVELAAGLLYNVLAGVLADVSIAKVLVVNFATRPAENDNTQPLGHGDFRRRGRMSHCLVNVPYLSFFHQLPAAVRSLCGAAIGRILFGHAC